MWNPALEPHIDEKNREPSRYNLACQFFFYHASKHFLRVVIELLLVLLRKIEVLSVGRELSSKIGRHPRQASNVIDKLQSGRLNLREDLDTGRDVADDGNSLICPVKRLVPTSTVYQLALETLNTYDLRPWPLVKESGGVDQYVCIILDGLTVLLHLEVIFAGR